MSDKNALIDQLLADCQEPSDVFSRNGLFGEIVERACHNGIMVTSDYEHYLHKISQKRREKIVERTAKQTKIKFSYYKQSNNIQEKVIALYAKGLSLQSISEYLLEHYNEKVSEKWIAKLVNTVSDEMQIWRQRMLDNLYPIIYIDGIVVMSRESGSVGKRTVYVALGINIYGQKEVLGLWIAPTESAKFWLSALNELKNRGVEDILILCCDGLKGLPEAVEAVYPKTLVQLCIVHQIRNSLLFVKPKLKKEVTHDLRQIYTAPTIEQAEKALAQFETNWHIYYPDIVPSWKRNWARLNVFFDFPEAIRKVIYTTNAIESLNSGLRKIAPSSRQFANDDVVFTAFYLCLNSMMKHWSAVRDWKPAMSYFRVYFEDRIKF